MPGAMFQTAEQLEQAVRSGRVTAPAGLEQVKQLVVPERSGLLIKHDSKHERQIRQATGDERHDQLRRCEC